MKLPSIACLLTSLAAFQQKLGHMDLPVLNAVVQSQKQTSLSKMVVPLAHIQSFVQLLENLHLIEVDRSQFLPVFLFYSVISISVFLSHCVSHTDIHVDSYTNSLVLLQDVVKSKSISKITC